MKFSCNSSHKVFRKIGNANIWLSLKRRCDGCRHRFDRRDGLDGIDWFDGFDGLNGFGGFGGFVI